MLLKLQKIKKFLSDHRLSAEETRWLCRLFSPYSMRLLGVTLLRCFIVVLGISSALINKHLVDWASAFLSVKGTILLTVGCSCTSLLSSALMSELSARLTHRCAIGIRADLYDHFLNSVWIERTRMHSEDQLSRLINDVERICDGMVSAVTGLVSTAVQFCLAFALLYTFDRVIACIALLSVPVIAVFSMGLGIYLKRLQLKARKADTECRVFLQEQLSHGDVVKAFEYEQESEQKFLKLQEQKMQLALKSSRCSIWMRVGVNGAFTGVYLFAFITGALKIASGSITYGTMTAFLSLVNQVQSPVLSLSNIFSQLVSVGASTSRVHELERLPLEKRTLKQIEPVGTVGISAKEISVSYQPDKPILQNVSFEIEPGSIAAIMGHSGIGKTTLIRLLLGFVPAEKGEAAFVCDQRKIPCSADTRKLISYVPQGNTLFSGTLAENLRVGCPDASQEQMWTALRMTCAEEFVRALPEGLETFVGEKGHGLSEGQAQRIAIARAFLRPAPVLLLDEATSALDEETELTILTHLKTECAHRTCVIVSHRNTIANFADQIIAL